MSWQISSRRTATGASRRTREADRGALPRATAGVAQGKEKIAAAAMQEAPPRYRRVQFLQDAAWMGLDPERAFSRLELRRQRDRLMSTHHPDRGGADETAAQINETYARMVGWLASRRFRREGRKVTEPEIAANRPAETRPSLYRSALSAAVQISAIQLSALALMAAVGYTALRRRRP
jgi:hypothetical protein